MSKGNPFLGYASGKLGDFVLYRQDGQQITRTRNRNPHNPKTEPQLYQRAIMATITAAYSAGSTLFDHSFQGYSKGAKCQREFTSRNARLLRAQIASDLANARTGAEQLGRVVGPKTQSPVGFPGMVVADGSYPMAAFVFTPQNVQGETACNWKLPAATANETCAEYAARVGLLAGDYYTFCGFAYAPELEQYAFIVPGHTGEAGAYQSVENFFFVRLGVKSSFVASSDAVSSKLLSDIFVADTYSPYADVEGLLAKAFGSAIELSDVIDINGETVEGYISLIRSRLDQDLRSHSALVWGADTSYNGLTSEFALEAWQAGTEALGNSQLILEGGGF